MDDPLDLEAALELVLQVTLLPLGGLLVHASAGVYGGRAWLLPGVSGAGKSTAARGGFDGVLSDERVVVRREGEGFVAWPTPFWSVGRTLPLHLEPAPLGVLARLNKADGVQLSEMEPAEAAAHLLSCVTLYETSPDARREAFELAFDLASSVCCVELGFPKEGRWIPTAHAQVCPPSCWTPSGTTPRSTSTGT